MTVVRYLVMLTVLFPVLVGATMLARLGVISNEVPSWFRRAADWCLNEGGGTSLRRWSGK